MRARILDLAHRGEEAIEAIDTVLEEVHGSEEKIFLSDLTRLRGEFLMRYRGPDAEPEAEKEFQEALGFARKQRALSYELRAAHSMANLMRSRGDEAGALDLLEPVFNRFTEGFDTADLISAKRTIDELKLRRDAVAPLAFSAGA
jgi:predicted ATPase